MKKLSPVEIVVGLAVVLCIAGLGWSVFSGIAHIRQVQATPRAQQLQRIKDMAQACYGLCDPHYIKVFSIEGHNLNEVPRCTCEVQGSQLDAGADISAK